MERAAIIVEARRRATEQHRDLAVEVEPLEIIDAQRRRVHGLADEHRRRLDFGLRFVEVGQRQELVLEAQRDARSEEHTSELQSLMRISYAVFCLKKNTSKQKK